jgi:hypothetical protein
MIGAFVLTLQGFSMLSNGSEIWVQGKRNHSFRFRLSVFGFRVLEVPVLDFVFQVEQSAASAPWPVKPPVTYKHTTQSSQSRQGFFIHTHKKTPRRKNLNQEVLKNFW